MTSLKEVTALVATLWPHPAWPAEVQVLFAEALADQPPDVLLAAVRHYWANDPKGFRPSPGQLRAVIESQLTAPLRDKADHAFDELRNAVGFYTSPRYKGFFPNVLKFDDPRAVDAVKALGGFKQFADGWDTIEESRLRAKFIAAYCGALTEQVSSRGQRRLR